MSRVYDYGARVIIGWPGSTEEDACSVLRDLPGEFAFVRAIHGRTGTGIEVDRKFSPDTDGEDHINIYSRGKTAIGRALSNFARTHIEVSDNLPWGVRGRFSSVEALWYYARCAALGFDGEEIRDTHGFTPKKRGRKIIGSKDRDYPEPENKGAHDQIIRAGLTAKLRQVADRPDFFGSDLPFVHYYQFVGRVIDAPEDWTHRWWADRRAEIRRGMGLEVNSRCWARRTR